MPVACITLSAVAFATELGWSSAEALRFGAASLGGLFVARMISWAVLVIARRNGLALRRTLIVGGGQRGRLVARKLRAFPEAGLLPVAMIPLGNGHGLARFLPDFPSAADLTRTISDADIHHVVLAPDESEEAIVECVKGSGDLDVTFSMLPPLSDLFLHPGLVTQVGGLPLIPLGKLAQTKTMLPGKRVFDIVGGSALIMILFPLMAIMSAAIKLSDRGPIFYRQRRVGRGGSTFAMLKFRSMIEGAERLVIDLRDQNINNGLLFKVRDDPRITRVGRLMRRISMDELPQLWNVVRGDMSLVGPRPLPVEPEDFGEVDNKRHTVRPGITGYWQIAGSHDLTYEEMIKLDLAYIQNWSLWLDVRLLLRTIPALMHRRGAW
jgi:exopolysaccharide biosynthesis polyprenyl glycosylphosphotransferase